MTTDQSHLRKYLTTLGIAIIAGTLSLAGLYLRLQRDLLVSQSDLNGLTPTSRDSLTKSQHYVATTTSLLPWLMLAGLLIGIILAIYGIVGWARRQKVADERDNYERDKVRTELQLLSDAEAADKLEQEAKDTAADNDRPLGNSQEALPALPAELEARASLANARTQVADTEAELIKKLREADSLKQVMPNVRVIAPNGLSYEFDAFVRDRKHRYLIELKLGRSAKNLTNQITAGLAHVARGASVAHNATGVLIVVTPDNPPEGVIERAMSRAQEIASDYRNPPRLIIYTASEFSSLNGSDLVASLRRS